MIREITNEDLEYINKNIEFFSKNKLELNNPFFKSFVYEENKKILGFINYSIIYEKAELNYIWVDEKKRRKKIASKLLEYMIKDCKNLENITLEVNENNEAIKLYEKYGFKKVAIRKNYYGNDDAILMLREMI